LLVSRQAEFKAVQKFFNQPVFWAQCCCCQLLAALTDFSQAKVMWVAAKLSLPLPLHCMP
jgi:hypothetical protein